MHNPKLPNMRTVLLLTVYMNSQPSDSYMPQQVIPHTTYNSLHAGRIPSQSLLSSTPTPSFPPASISQVFDMSTTHQCTPDPSANLPQPSANPNLSTNPSAKPSSTPSAVLATGNPQPIDATTMANAINYLVKSNLPVGSRLGNLTLLMVPTLKSFAPSSSSANSISEIIKISSRMKLPSSMMFILFERLSIRLLRTWIIGSHQAHMVL